MLPTSSSEYEKFLSQITNPRRNNNITFLRNKHSKQDDNMPVSPDNAAGATNSSASKLITKQRQELADEEMRLNKLLKELDYLSDTVETDKKSSCKLNDCLTNELLKPTSVKRNLDSDPYTEIIDAFDTSLLLEKKPPKFHDEFEKNTVKFLDEFEVHCWKNGIAAAKDKLQIIRDQCFEGKAKNWIESYNGNLDTYDNFKKAFLDEFYSDSIRARIKQIWLNRTFDPECGDVSYHDYFQQQLKEARYFEPKMSDFEVNYSIIGQLPEFVVKSLDVINFDSSYSIANSLAFLDITKDFETESDEVKISKPMEEQQQITNSPKTRRIEDSKLINEQPKKSTKKNNTVSEINTMDYKLEYNFAYPLGNMNLTNDPNDKKDGD